jgi:hypothetical protein
MAHPPQHKHCSTQSLSQKFEEQNWAERLGRCRTVRFDPELEYSPQFYTTLRQRWIKYYEADELVAVIFYYHRLDGTERRSIRMLLIDSIRYCA